MCSEKRAKALVVVKASEFSELELEAMWADQVRTQTRPQVRATAGLADKAINVIIELMDLEKSLDREIVVVEAKMVADNANDVVGLSEAREGLRRRRELVSSKIDRERKALGVGDGQNLKRLLSNKYLSVSRNSGVTVQS